jgi:DAK2 domain fusion protein YloV
MDAPGGTIELTTVSRFVDVAADALAVAREEIDALNVYPVPDGDTGTNMFLTMTAARDAIHEALERTPEDPQAVMEAFARGALLGARGNSGVILSQMLGAIATRLRRRRPEERNATLMADAIREATEASWAAVGVPVEGTILSVAQAASDAAVATAEGGAVRAREVCAAAADAARQALLRTPEQLPVLAEAGVVDAGGRGLSVVLDALAQVLTGRRPPTAAPGIGHHQIPVPAARGGDLSDDGPAYEVMYLLDAEDQRVPDLRRTLAGLGDSLVVVGGGGLWNVHVHTDDVGAAVEAGIEAGRPHRVRVTHFAEQVAAARRRVEQRRGRAVVAVAAGPGLAALFEDAGAVVVPGGPGRRPSAGMLLDAISRSGCSEVVLLPNDPDTVRTAEVAATTAEEDHGTRVAVVATQAQVQGLAALAVHEPGRSFEQDVLEMTATARHARHGAVTIASKQAMTMGGPCEPGDVLGVVAGDFAVVGQDLADVAAEVLDRLLGGGGELVTVVAGGGPGDAALAAACSAHVEAHYPHVDVVVYDGGQDRYPLLVAVE